MNRILITGSSGLIGSHLSRSLGLQESPAEVFQVIRPKSEPAPGAVGTPIGIDLSSPNWDTAKLPPRMDAVIHLAQSPYFRDFPQNVQDVFQVNIATTLKLLDYARRAGAQHFILASSGGVYGYSDQEFTEDAELSVQQGLGFYLGSKLQAEILAENYLPYFKVSVLRFFFVYGPGQRRTMLIPRLVQSVIEGKPITLSGQDGIRTNPTHVDDAVRAIEGALHLDESHKINIGGPEPLTLRAIGETIGEVVGRKPVFDIREHERPRNLIGDISKMSRLLCAPTVRLKDGVRTILPDA